MGAFDFFNPYGKAQQLHKVRVEEEYFFYNYKKFISAQNSNAFSTAENNFNDLKQAARQYDFCTNQHAHFAWFLSWFPGTAAWKARSELATAVDKYRKYLNQIINLMPDEDGTKLSRNDQRKIDHIQFYQSHVLHKQILRDRINPNSFKNAMLLLLAITMFSLTMLTLDTMLQLTGYGNFLLGAHNAIGGLVAISTDIIAIISVCISGITAFFAAKEFIRPGSFMMTLDKIANVFQYKHVKYSHKNFYASIFARFPLYASFRSNRRFKFLSEDDIKRHLYGDDRVNPNKTQQSKNKKAIPKSKARKFLFYLDGTLKFLTNPFRPLEQAIMFLQFCALGIIEWRNFIANSTDSRDIPSEKYKTVKNGDYLSYLKFAAKFTINLIATIIVIPTSITRQIFDFPYVALKAVLAAPYKAYVSFMQGYVEIDASKNLTGADVKTWRKMKYVKKSHKGDKRFQSVAVRPTKDASSFGSDNSSLIFKDTSSGQYVKKSQLTDNGTYKIYAPRVLAKEFTKSANSEQNVNYKKYRKFKSQNNIL